MTEQITGPVESGVTGLRRGAEEKRSLGERIRALRKQLGKTQAEFAKLVGGVSMATVSSWENGRPPHNKYFNRMLEIAKEHGGLSNLIGTDERELMLARFHAECPKKGALMFLDFAVNRHDELGEVIMNICGAGASLNNFIALGDDAAPRTEALALAFAPDFEVMNRVKRYLTGSERVIDPHLSFKSQGAQMPVGDTSLRG